MRHRLCYRERHPKERGLLAGAAAGGAQLALAAYPLAGAAFGAAGLRAALLAGAANALAVWAVGYLLFSTAGAAFPERCAPCLLPRCCCCNLWGAAAAGTSPPLSPHTCSAALPLLPAATRTPMAAPTAASGWAC